MKRRLSQGVGIGSRLVTDSTQPSEGAGSVIGRYKILEQIGEGGFGAVFVAEQRDPVKRRVALKIIKWRQHDPHSRRQRLAGSQDSDEPHRLGFFDRFFQGWAMDGQCRRGP